MWPEKKSVKGQGRSSVRTNRYVVRESATQHSAAGKVTMVCNASYAFVRAVRLSSTIAINHVQQTSAGCACELVSTFVATDRAKGPTEVDALLVEEVSGKKVV